MIDYEKEVQKNKDFIIFYELFKEIKQIPEVKKFELIENDERVEALQFLKTKIVSSLKNLEKRTVEQHFFSSKSIDREPLAKSLESKLKIENAAIAISQTPMQIEIEVVKEKPVEDSNFIKEKVELLQEAPLVIELLQEFKVQPPINETTSQMPTTKCKLPYSPLDLFEDEAKEKIDRKKILTKAVNPLMGIHDKRLLFSSSNAIIKPEVLKIKKIEDKAEKPLFPRISTNRSEFLINLMSYYNNLDKKYPKTYSGKFIHFEGSNINGIRNLAHSSEITAYPCKPFKKIEIIDYDIESEDEYLKHYLPMTLNPQVQEEESEAEQIEVEEDECIHENQEKDSDYSSMQLSENESSMNDEIPGLEIIDQNSNPIPNEASQSNLNIVECNDSSKLLKPIFTVKLNDKDLPNSTKSDSSAILETSELDKYLFDIIRLIHYSFENSKNILKEKVMTEFKPKRKDLETFFNLKVIKSKCDQSKEVTLIIIETNRLFILSKKS